MRRIYRVLATALALLALAGCDAGFSGVTERPLASGAASPVPVPPQDGDVAPNRIPVTLYYRYYDEPYLAPYAAILEVTSDKSVEQALIERLIQGPDADRSEYTALIDSATTVSVAERSEYLEVTLSQIYVDSMTSLPDPWTTTAQDYENELMRMRNLALNSIINTVTEMGVHSRVMIRIDRGLGDAEKLLRSEGGFDSNMDRAIDPLPRDTSLVLTARRCAELALEELQARDWGALGGWIASADVDGTQPPVQLDGALNNRPALISFSFLDGETVMPLTEGSVKGIEQTVLCMDAAFRDSLGNVKEVWNVPLRMVRTGGIWQIAYASLDAAVPAS